MRLDRRRFLALSTGSLAAATLPGCGGKDAADTAGSLSDTAPEPAPERPAEPGPWEAPGAEDSAAFSCGIQVGDVTPSAARVSVISSEPELALTWVAQDGETWGRPATAAARTLVGGAVQFDLEGLSPDTAYRIAATTPDGSRRSVVGRFRTAPSPGDALRRISFGATSCLAANRPWPSLSHAAAQDLDFFCLLGDTVYADDAQSLDGYRSYWRSALAEKGLRDVTASTSLVATWDDHEVDNNWSRSTLDPAKFEAALTAFREHLPQRQGPGGTGIWRSLRWGDVLELFVLDSRAEREGEDYLSPEQLAWLRESLSASGARFKVVLNSVPITDLWNIFQDVQDEDRWQGYPRQRAELLGHIVEQGLEGVIFLSGDLHYGQVGHVDPEGGLAHSLHEVLVGPGGSQVNVLAAVFPGNPQYEQIIAQWNWCRFDCDPALGTIRVRHFGDDGATLSDWELSV